MRDIHPMDHCDRYSRLSIIHEFERRLRRGAVDWASSGFVVGGNAWSAWTRVCGGTRRGRLRHTRGEEALVWLGAFGSLMRGDACGPWRGAEPAVGLAGGKGCPSSCRTPSRCLARRHGRARRRVAIHGVRVAAGLSRGPAQNFRPLLLVWACLPRYGLRVEGRGGRR